MVRVDLPMLRTRLGIPTSIVSDDELASILTACTETQTAHCDTQNAHDESLDRALVRRVGREIAARGLPLGAQNTEFGTAYIPNYDPILRQLEAPYLRGGFA